ncbi:MAG: hypothetical protein H5T78_11550 [Nocardia sp.]|nr:hypothetical protein [Nocardia sp.]
MREAIADTQVSGDGLWITIVNTPRSLSSNDVHLDIRDTDLAGLGSHHRHRLATLRLLSRGPATSTRRRTRDRLADAMSRSAAMIFLIAALVYPFRGDLSVASEPFETVYLDVIGR